MSLCEPASREELIALASLPKVNGALMRRLDSVEVTVGEFLHLSRPELAGRLGCDPLGLPDDMARQTALAEARKALASYDDSNIRILQSGRPGYPRRLWETDDAPPVLFQSGHTVLDAAMTVSVVGTRTPTPYGLDLCRKLVKTLAETFPGLVVVSGLAYGIDACAHTAALEAGVSTVGVVAHGLQKVYPSVHRELAARMVRNGGSVLTQYRLGEDVFRQRFLERNRIVAGMADVTVVVESPLKGGAMSTATAAFEYNREVMAFPGRVSDEKSGGCNLLIRREKAHLITCAADLTELMGWNPAQTTGPALHRSLFPELDGDLKTVYEALRSSADPIHQDRILQLTQLGVGRVTAALAELEYEGVALRHPGNRYSPA